MLLVQRFGPRRKEILSAYGESRGNILRTRVVLLRARDDHGRGEALPDDFGLVGALFPPFVGRESGGDAFRSSSDP